MDIDKDIQLIQSRNLEDLKTHYNTFKKELLKLDTQNNIISSVHRFRDGQLNTNEQRLMDLEKDINSKRRQVEISQNSSVKKLDWINILRFFFLYLCVLFLVIFGLRGNPYFNWIVSILTIIVLFMIGSQLYSFTQRDPNRWSVIKFKTTIRDLATQDEEEQCLSDPDEGLNEADLAEKNRLLAEIVRLKNTENQMDTSDKNLSIKIKDLEAQRKEIQENIEHIQKNLAPKN